LVCRVTFSVDSSSVDATVRQSLLQLGNASVTIAESRIYTAGDIGELNVITAMDLDGRIQWQVNNGTAWTKPSRVALGVALRVDSFRSAASRKGKVR